MSHLGTNEGIIQAGRKEEEVSDKYHVHFLSYV